MSWHLFRRVKHEKIVCCTHISYILLYDLAVDYCGDRFSRKKIIRNIKSTRPLMFCFNGGPGRASIWVHLGTFGPKKSLHELIERVPVKHRILSKAGRTVPILFLIS